MKKNESRNEFPPLLSRFLSLLFQKALEMIDKSESVNRANVWWILGADYFNFEGVMDDFRKKKISCRLISRGKKACKEIP